MPACPLPCHRRDRSRNEERRWDCGRRRPHGPHPPHQIWALPASTPSSPLPLSPPQGDGLPAQQPHALSIVTPLINLASICSNNTHFIYEYWNCNQVYSSRCMRLLLLRTSTIFLNGWWSVSWARFSQWWTGHCCVSFHIGRAFYVLFVPSTQQCPFYPDANDNCVTWFGFISRCLFCT